MKTVKLPNRLALALARYYINRNLSRPQIESQTYSAGECVSTTTTKGRPWDRDADFKAIEEATPKGWWWEAVAGTFWFSGMSKHHHYYANESLWPNAEVHPNKVKA